MVKTRWIWLVVVVASTAVAVATGGHVLSRVVSAMFGHTWANEGLFGPYRGAVVAGFAATSALAFGSYRSSRDTRPLFLAIATGILAGGYLAFSAAWPQVGPPDLNRPPRLSWISMDGLLLCWIAAAICFKVSVPWWDRRGRKPVSPQRALLLTLGPLALAVAALFVWDPGATITTAEHIEAVGLNEPPSLLLHMALFTLAIALLFSEVRKSWIRSRQDPSHGASAAAYLLGAVAVIGTYYNYTSSVPRSWAAGLSFLLPGVCAGALFLSLLSTQRTESSRARRATDQAKQVMGGRAEIASMIAHELRGPVSTVRGLATTAATHYDSITDAERLEFFKLVDQEARRLLHIVDETSMALKVDARTLTYDIRPEDLSRITADAVRKAATGEHPVQVEGADERIEIPLDRLRMEETLVQLLENAAKFSPAETPIVVRVQVQTDAVTVDVLDQGPGIAPEMRGRAFDRFAKFRPKGYEEVPGPGLGLFIARSHLRELGGDLTIEEASRGTMLRIELPLEGLSGS